MLVKTAGVKFLIVLINKMDDPTVEWSKDRYIEISLLDDTPLIFKQQLFLNMFSSLSFNCCFSVGIFLKINCLFYSFVLTFLF